MSVLKQKQPACIIIIQVAFDIMNQEKQFDYTMYADEF